MPFIENPLPPKMEFWDSFKKRFMHVCANGVPDGVVVYFDLGEWRVERPEEENRFNGISHCPFCGEELLPQRPDLVSRAVDDEFGDLNG